jgi:regulator of replication initiation timing
MPNQIAQQVFATVDQLCESTDWLRSQLDASRAENQELLRQKVLLEQENASLRDEVKRYRDNGSTA